MKALITYGGTREAIDQVRYIGNFSTGNTGYKIATYLEKMGAEVFCLRGVSSPSFSKEKVFTSFQDLDELCKQVLSTQDFDIIIHAAAVSDYTLKSIETTGKEKLKKSGGKIHSGQDIYLHLEPTPKILEKLKSYSKNKNLRVIAFKLTENATEEEIKEAIKKISLLDIDYIVQNDLSNISSQQHKGHIYKKNNQVISSFQTKEELAKSIYTITQEIL